MDSRLELQDHRLRDTAYSAGEATYHFGIVLNLSIVIVASINVGIVSLKRNIKV